MANYNDGRVAKVGDTVRLPDGHTGTVTHASPVSGNESSVTVEVTVAARTVTPL
jgi:hypothetical protein